MGAQSRASSTTSGPALVRIESFSKLAGVLLVLISSCYADFSFPNTIGIDGYGLRIMRSMSLGEELQIMPEQSVVGAAHLSCIGNGTFGLVCRPSQFSYVELKAIGMRRLKHFDNTQWFTFDFLFGQLRISGERAFSVCSSTRIEQSSGFSTCVIVGVNPGNNTVTLSLANMLSYDVAYVSV